MNIKTYTFHVSLPGTGRTWRKIEMRADQTLADLHIAIQDAFRWSADHLYSFYMSGKAWDQHTEYCLPEGIDPWNLWNDEDFPVIDENGAPIETSSDPDVEEDTEEKLPGDLPLTLQSLQEKILQMMSAFETSEIETLGDIEKLIGDIMFPNRFEDMIKQLNPPPGDVRTTTLESLKLKPKQKFMYLFDYGDEWRFKVRVHAVNLDALENIEYPRIVESVGDAPSQYGRWDEED